MMASSNISYNPKPAYTFSDIFIFKDNKKTDPSCCPVCGLSVRIGDLDSHFIQELEKLYKISTTNRFRRNKEHLTSSSDGSLENRWEAYLRIKSNRHCRLRMKTRKKKPDDVVCPICNENVFGSMQQLNSHVELCLRKHGTYSEQEEEETVDVEGEGDSYEDYEWSAQSRVPSSMLLNSYDGVASRQNCANSRVSGEENRKSDLAAEREDSSHYGPIQYTDADLVLSLTVDSNQEPEENAESPTSQITMHPKDLCNIGKKSENSSIDSDAERANSSDNDHVIQALKHRIRELETNYSSEHKMLCLICKDQYVKPLVSVACWHVHCEQCWLHTLGAKKLCPQCNMITSPTDLRRVFM
ncbi:E3 ubiquitin-protein ligase RNF220 [Cimex lectularius]|uniref:RING-type domain-containing protein n=1 Tax=Cimex lectularius TaxID=79782 RepID=A0A8I6S5I8_CIMLE|nr:E3 ubiquitin-protein ligase RNF220 [Cimex lectularius]